MILSLARNGNYRTFAEKEQGGIWWHLVQQSKKEAFVPARTTMVLNPQWHPVEKDKVNSKEIDETLNEKLSDRIPFGIYLPDTGLPIGNKTPIKNLYNTHYLRGQNETVATLGKADDAPFVLKACASLSMLGGPLVFVLNLAGWVG